MKLHELKEWRNKDEKEGKKRFIFFLRKPKDEKLIKEGRVDEGERECKSPALIESFCDGLKQLWKLSLVPDSWEAIVGNGE